MLRMNLLGVAVAVLLATTARADEEKPLPPEVQQLQFRQLRRATQRAADANVKLDKAKPIVLVDPNSLSMTGDGLGGRTRYIHFRRSLGNTNYLLASGTLYYQTDVDFNERHIRFYVDTKVGPVETARELAEDLKAWEPLLKKHPEVARAVWGQDLADCLKRIANSVKRYQEARTPADLDLLQSLLLYENWLKGPLALTEQQVAKMKAGVLQRQAFLEEFGKVAQTLMQHPEDAAARKKIFELVDQARSKSRLDHSAVFTLEQRRVLGLEPDPQATRPARQQSVVAAASSGGDEPPAEDAAEAKKRAAEAAEQARKMEQWRRQQQAEEKHNRRAAPVRFHLQGHDAKAEKISMRTRDGLLWMYVDDHPDHSGARFLFYLDQEKTWAWEKAKMIQRAREEQTRDGEKPEYRAYYKKDQASLERSPNYFFYQWVDTIDDLRAKTSEVPKDVQARFDAMVRGTLEATEALLTAYQAAVAHPNSPELQRNLFEAFRQACRTHRRHNALTMRALYDLDGDADDLPWLLSMDQTDLLAQGSRCTASEMTSGAVNMAISAHPAGSKQYVSVTAEGAKLGDLAETVQRVARQYYHNHRLTLKVDPKATDNPVRGMVEGKSAEELIKSLATRSGVRLEKDKKTPQHYHLKP
jgi:hypothetical protein